jgi:dolichol kinase
VAIAGSVTAFTSSTAALLVGFEVVDWTPTQIGLLLGLVATLTTLIGSWAARDAVTPV